MPGVPLAASTCARRTRRPRPRRRVCAPGQAWKPRTLRAPPVHEAVFLLYEGGEARPGGILRPRNDGTFFQSLQRAHEQFAAQGGEARLEDLGGFLRADGRRFGKEQRPGIEPLVDEHRRHTGLGLAVDDRPLHRRRAAIAGKERSVDVDGAARSDVDHAAGQDLAVGDDDLDLGHERLQGGLLVDPSPASLANALERMLRDPAEARRLGEHGRSIAATMRWADAGPVVERALRDAIARFGR